MSPAARGGLAFTGTGLVTSVGDTAEELLRARPRARAGPIADFDPGRYLQRKGLRHLSRTSQLACAAASRISTGLADVAPDEVGVVLGSAWAGLDSIVRFEREAHVEGPRYVDPGLFAETVANVPAGHVSIVFGWSALNLTVAAGSVSGLQAILSARELLAEGRAGVVIAGGADSSLHAAAALDAAPGEGHGPGSEAACFLALEWDTHRAARGAAALARLAGGAAIWIDPRSEHVASARFALFGAALTESGLRARDIGLVVACGGTALPSRGEEALRDLFEGSCPPVLRPDEALGETWAAAGPLATVAAVESLRLGRARHALVIGDGPSGHHAALVISEAG